MCKAWSRENKTAKFRKKNQFESILSHKLGYRVNVKTDHHNILCMCLVLFLYLHRTIKCTNSEISVSAQADREGWKCPK